MFYRGVPNRPGQRPDESLPYERVEETEQNRLYPRNAIISEPREPYADDVQIIGPESTRHEQSHYLCYHEVRIETLFSRLFGHATR